MWPACLNCYNNGRHVSQWVDCTDAADRTIESLHEGSGEPLADSEEIWCLDHENIPIKGEMGLAEAARWGETYDEADPEQWSAICALMKSGCYTAEGTGDIPSLPDFEETYQGRWGSFREYAGQLADVIRLTDGWSEEA